MKILHLLGAARLPADPDRQPASGVVRAALELARAQAECGHSVELAVIEEAAATDTWHGVRILRLPRAKWARLRIAGRTLDLQVHAPYVARTWSHRYDVVHGHRYYYQRFLRAGLRVAHFHGDPSHKGHGDVDISLGRGDFASIAAHTDAQVAVSGFIADRLRQGLGPDARISVVHNGVDVGRFRSADATRAGRQLREDLGIPEGAFVFAYAGAIVREKGVHVLADAFGRLARKRPDVHLLLVGSSGLWGENFDAADPNASYEGTVRDRLREAADAGRVHPVGSVPALDMPRHYAAADALVIPSVWNEPAAMVSMEAVAAGLPVISSAVGGLPELLEGHDAQLVPHDDIDALVQAMEELLARPSGSRSPETGFSRPLPTWAGSAAALDRVYASARSG